MVIQVKKVLMWVLFLLSYKYRGDFIMNIIDLELVRKRKSKENKMISIPIIERVFEVNGEIQFEVAGEKEVPISWLEKE